MEIEKNLDLNIDLESEDLQKLFKKVTSFQLLTISEIKFVCDKSKEILKKEPTILSLTPPITLVGDIHGQYQDLLEIFYQQGYPKDGISFVFIGFPYFIDIKNSISESSIFNKGESRVSYNNTTIWFL